MSEGTDRSPAEPPVAAYDASVTSDQPITTTAEVPPVGTAEVVSVPPAPIPSVAPPEIPPPPSGQASPPSRRGRKKLVVIVASIAAVAIVASIAAVALSGGGAKPSGTGSAKGPAASPLALLAPIALAADPGAFSVTLTWAQPAGGADIEGYTVYKDGDRVGEVGAGTTTFTDVRVAPGKDYTYEIEATGGGKATDRVSVSVMTPVPPLSAARLSGEFNIKLKPTTQYGFQSRYTRTTLGWTFAPKCSDGACNVVWRDLFYKGFKTTLVRKGAAYSGSDNGKFDVRCVRTAENTVLTLKFKVTKARALDGEWRAVKLVGTLTQREAPQLGCVSSGVNWRFTGSLA